MPENTKTGSFSRKVRSQIRCRCGNQHHYRHENHANFPLPGTARGYRPSEENLFKNLKHNNRMG